MQNLLTFKLFKKVAIILSLIITLVGSLTFVMTYKNIGFGEQFVGQWLSSLLLAATTMAPLGFLMVALITKLVSVVMPTASENKRNFVIGLSMALIMESFMALVTTINNLGFPEHGTLVNQWLQDWGQAILIALPFGLVTSLMMTLFVKPKLERLMAS
jgi:hypothetical protein